MRRNVLTTHHVAKRLRWCQEHIQWRCAQWRTVLFSNESRFKCSEQIDVPESIDVIMNVMPPIVFWDMFVSVMVVS